MMDLKLPDEQQTILDVILNKIKREYKDDIDAVICYGSYVTDTYHNMSDLDFYFIPKTDKAYEMCLQFIINDIGYDLWPITWNRLEEFVNLKQDLTSLVAKGVIVYQRSNQVEERFYSLKMNAEMLLETDLAEAVKRHLKDAKALYFDMYEDKVDHVAKILEHLVHAVAYLNKKYIVKSIDHIKEECKTYPLKPLEFIERINRIISNPYLVVNSEVEKLISDVTKLSHKKEDPYELKGMYEEMKSSYNKVHYACDNEDYFKVYFTLSSIYREIKSVLGFDYHTYPFPDLASEIRKKDYRKIKELTARHEEVFLYVLNERNVTINKYKDCTEFEVD